MTGRELVDRFGRLMAEGDLTGLGELYSEDAQVVMFSHITRGRAEIVALLDKTLQGHGAYDVVSIDQFRDSGDVVMWDATVETKLGMLQTTHVVVRNESGTIIYHVPGIRGYWGM